MSANKLKDASNDHSYFIVTPQLIWAKSRNSYDYALWSVIKMIAGDNGECILATPDLATLAMMSSGQVSNSRKYLLECGLLAGEFKRDPGYPQPVWHLRIPDVWAENLAWRKGLGDELASRIAWKDEQKKSLHTVKPSHSEKGVIPGDRGITYSDGGITSGETKDIHDRTIQEPNQEPPPSSENPLAGLPTGTDSHQRAVDKANGSATPDPVEQVAKHLYWGFMGAPGLDLPHKERKKWTEAARRLLDGIPLPLDVRAVCGVIDRWWASEIDQFWKDKPCNAETIDLIRKFAVNGGSNAPHQRPGKKGARSGISSDPAIAEQQRIVREALERQRAGPKT